MEWLPIQFHYAINSNISVSTFSGIKLFSLYYGNNEFFYGQWSPECNLQIFKGAETFKKKSQRPAENTQSLTWLQYAATYLTIEVIKDLTVFFCSIV